MKDFLKRFWPWKRIAFLEACLDEHKANHSKALVDLNGERTAHSETKQHLKAVRDAHAAGQKSLRDVATAIALKVGIK